MYRNSNSTSNGFDPVVTILAPTYGLLHDKSCIINLLLAKALEKLVYLDDKKVVKNCPLRVTVLKVPTLKKFQSS